MRLFSFILALLLLAGTIDPTRGWLITLVVISGIAWVRPRPWNPFDVRLAIDARLAAFVLAVLLLAGTIDPTRDWLIALSAVTGVAAFMPRVFAIDPFGFERRHRRGFRFDWDWDWHRDWDEDDEDGMDGRWRRWERRMGRIERRARRRAGRFGDDWP